MKNLQVSFNDLEGRRFNGHDLHLRLIDKGWQAKQLVWGKLSDDPNTFEIGRFYQDANQLKALFTTLQNNLAAHNTLYPFSYSLLFDEKYLEADIVHYHLIHNYFFNITHLPILTKLKPSVWTLHDPWALTGHCIHFFDCQKWKHGCGDCPSLGMEFALQKDTSAINWEIKRIAYQASNIDLIVSSKWMYDIVRESPLLQHFETHIVPFGIDRQIFRPTSKEQAKAFFRIPQRNRVIAFRAASWKLKGLDYIKEALARLKEKRDITLLTSNETGLIAELAKDFHIVELGWIDDLEVLQNYYNAADMFLMPSAAESFGMSAVESMACGTPVITFADTVVVDTINAPEGGIAVSKGSSDALAEAIESLLSDDDRRCKLGAGAVGVVEKKYDLDRYVNSIIGIYQHVITKRREDKRASELVKQMQGVKFPESHVLSYDLNFKELLKMQVSHKLKEYPITRKVLRTIYRMLMK